MIYNSFKDLSLSALGMGCMRLPVITEDTGRLDNGAYENIDEEATRKMVAFAMESGINYYDTAYMYHHGNSERVMGRILNEYPREKYYFATKFPGFDPAKLAHPAETFEEQLEKTQKEYIDFYLFHNICERNIEAYLDPDNGILPYFLKQKELGRIRHLGFSSHGKLPTLERFLKTYAPYMEFGQLEINYVDWTAQQGKEKVELLNSFGIPVWIMEPLRGGALASLLPEEEARLKALRPGETVPGWAFRFLQTVPGVTMILSGMSDFVQMQANIKTFGTREPLNETEMATILGIAERINEKKTLLCTRCRYCTEYCPQGLDIPKLLSCYNEYCLTGRGSIAMATLKDIPAEKLPTACIGCGKCASVCPQSIDIPGAMKRFAEMMD